MQEGGVFSLKQRGGERRTRGYLDRFLLLPFLEEVLGLLFHCLVLTNDLHLQTANLEVGEEGKGSHSETGFQTATYTRANPHCN